MNRTLSVFKMQLRDKFSWLVLPWIIMGISFAVNLVLAAGMMEEKLVTGGLSSIFIFYFVLSITIPIQTFPFALGMGIRRTDYFLGTSLVAVFVGALMSFLLVLLSVMEGSWFANWGVGLQFFHFPIVSDAPIPMQFVSYLILFLFLFFSGFAISSVYRKFGKTGMFVFFAVAFAILAFTPMLISYYDRWDEIGRWVEANIHSMEDVTLRLLPVAALFALASYALLRRSTV